MKIHLKKLLAVAILAGAIAVPVSHALPTVTVLDGPGSPGGIFTAVTSADGTFLTFCLEKTEFVTVGQTYYYSKSYEAKYNGTVSTPDPISLATAWLYRNYTTISGYGNNATENNAVQGAFWYFEDETGAVSNAYVTAALAATGVNWHNDSNGAYGVGVLNIWGNVNGRDPNNHQDLLRPVPDGGFTVALLGLAFGSLAIISRKIRR